MLPLDNGLGRMDLRTWMNVSFRLLLSTFFNEGHF